MRCTRTPALRISLAVVKEVQACLEARLRADESKIMAHRVAAFKKAGVPFPELSTSAITARLQPNFTINAQHQTGISEVVRRLHLSLRDTIRLWRGQCEADPRPNKARRGDHLPWLLEGFSQLPLLLDMIRNGLTHDFRPIKTSNQSASIANHKSARRWSNALRRSICEGQDAGIYLVVDIDAAAVWKEVHISSFGCVPKADADPTVEARVIHDLSYPAGHSINSSSDTNTLPRLQYEHVHKLARRIEELKTLRCTSRVKLKRGDVKSAFRNVYGSTEVCGRFAGKLPDDGALVIDLALPFGWTGSPAHYGVFGSAITHLVKKESPATLDPCATDPEPFFCYTRVDDHVLVEEDRANRLELCESVLRLAMLAVLGPRSINEKKFSSWSTRLRALGLDWDTELRSVSMPGQKITKALLRVHAMLQHKSATRTQLCKLLGSLRHVCSCIHSAKPLFQIIAALHRRAPRLGPIAVSEGAILDLQWFQHILRHGQLQSIPLKFFGEFPAPDVCLYMDASDTGLCALHPARREYIRLKFDEEERTRIRQGGFSISIREQLGAVLATLCWGREWCRRATSEMTHVRCWIDNRSAVAWCNNLNSREPSAQELNRVLGAIEAQWALYVSAKHLPGAINTMADLGSRAWDDPRLTNWRSLTNGWTQISIPNAIRKIYSARWSAFSSAPSLNHLDVSTREPGSNGQSFVSASECQGGSRNTTWTRNPYCWLSSPFIAGPEEINTVEPLQVPFSLKSAISTGIIGHLPDSNLGSVQIMPSLSPECVEEVQQQGDEVPSREQCCSGLSATSTSNNPSTALSQGLHYWASFFYSEALNT